MAWNSFLALLPLSIALWRFREKSKLSIAISTLCIALLSFCIPSVLRGLSVILDSLDPLHRAVLGAVVVLFVTAAVVPSWRRHSLNVASIAGFLLLLPNAPYVLTDIVHFFEFVRSTSSVAQIVVVAIPMYTLFLTIGFGAYVASLSLFSRFVHTLIPRLGTTVIEVVVHALCAFGIYLGRINRLNSWDLATQPDLVLSTSVQVLSTGKAMFIIGLTFLVLWSLFSISRLFVRALVEYLRVRTSILNGFFRLHEKGSG